MLRQSPPSIATLTVLLALATVSESTFVYRQQMALAQSPVPLSVPSAVPEGTTVRIDGSNSMAAVNQALKQKFETQYPGTTVETARKGSETALEALRADQLDLVGLGRPLTAEEQAEGLVQTPLTRRKIAVIVGAQNPFPGDLTGEQFAQIFRGEITNWSQVGGPDKPIRVIDRPASDTRSALQPYPVFQSAPFETGATAEPIDNDSINGVIRRLGDDGISYAIVDQVADNPGVKIVSLYGTPPTDPNYPFSQPLSYVYKGPTPNPSVQAFLGYVTTPDAQQALAVAVLPQPKQGSIFDLFKPKSDTASPAASPTEAPTTGTTTAPTPTTAEASPANPPVSPAPAAPVASPPVAQSPADPGAVSQAPVLDTGEPRSGIPSWLWLLSIPVLGALIWALLRGADRSGETTAAPVAAPVGAVADTGAESRIVLVPRSSQEAYAYWEVPEAHKQRIRKEEGGDQLAVRLYDVTGQDADIPPIHSIRQFECSETDQDLHIPIPQSDRDYVAEIGYVTYQGRWCTLARSTAVHVPAEGELPSDAASDLPDIPPVEAPASPTLPTGPRWEDSFKSGGTPLVDPMTTALQAAGATVEGAEGTATGSTIDAPIDPSINSDLISSDLISSDLSSPLDGSLAGAALGTGAVGAVAASQAGQKNRVRRSQIVLVPRNAQDAYAYWEVLDHHKEIAKQHGGETFTLRICDVTGINLEHEAPHSIQQFNCEETDRDRHVTVPDLGEYVAEIGYLATNGRWLRIARSAPVSLPPSPDQA